MRVKYRGEPDPRTPWDEIVPGLFMGGHFYRDAAGELVPVIVREEFDTVISLYSRDGHGPSGTVAHHLREVPDGPMSAAQLAAVSDLAEIAAGTVESGHKVLARCHSGYNRSGLVIVQALANLGYSVDDGIFLVRRRRSKWALNNHLFVDYLTTGLDVAQLLTDLGT
jgi:protein-tyrosine phosphatase